MSRLDKKIEKLEREMKAVNEALGLGNDAAKNINMLVETIRIQAGEMNLLNNDKAMLNDLVILRNQFLNSEPELMGKFETFLKSLTQPDIPPEKPAEPPALEIKDICAPHPTDQSKTICGELQPESRMIRHGEFVTCEDCLAVLNQKTPPDEPVAAPEAEQPQDAGGKIVQAEP